MANFEQLRLWRLSECDRDWEHTYGIRITSTDRPGWKLVIALAETDYEDLRVPHDLLVSLNAKGITADTGQKIFTGQCGLGQFTALLKAFIESLGPRAFEGKAVKERGFDGMFERLDTWYANHCDGTWEMRARIQISSTDDPGWILEIDYEGTELERKPLTIDLSVPLEWSQSDIDWSADAIEWTREQVPWSQADTLDLHAEAKGFRFRAWGDHSQLGNIILLFLNHAESCRKMETIG